MKLEEEHLFKKVKLGNWVYPAMVIALHNDHVWLRFESDTYATFPREADWILSEMC